MYKKKSQLHFSPSDLTKYMQSPFASWMDRFSIEYPEQTPQKDESDELMLSLQQKGYAHEDTLEAKFIAEGKSLIKIDGKDNAEKFANTQQAMQQGFEVIVQARLELGQFGGFADFLIKVDNSENVQSDYDGWHYKVWDTKLSSRIKPTFIVQLCCYAHMLGAIQGCVPERISVALGNGEIEELRTYDFYYYYLNLKSAFLEEQDSFDANQPPDPSNSNSWGNWSNYAEQLLFEQDHLSQVANVTKGQIKKLNNADIHTMQQLVDSSLTVVRGIHPTVFSRIKSQASIQSLTKQQFANAISNTNDLENNIKLYDNPEFEILPHPSQSSQVSEPNQNEIIDKKGLSLLPPHSPLDVFFDIEGFSLDEGGLEYLWGNTYFDEHGNRQFKDFWAHDRQQEKQCFQDFIQWVYNKWQQDPSMHIYHYASYEISACRKLMGRYGVCEYEVDQLLRNEVFVDLYKVVKGGVRLGAPRYSIKNVEMLYRDKRDTEVGNGGDSLVVYEQWRELYNLGEEGDTWQTSKILSDIRDYNIDDCESTQELVDWLRKQQSEHSIEYLGKTEVEEPELTEEVSNTTQLRDRLLQKSEQQLIDNPDQPEQAKLTENLAWMLEFHRREAKPIFWRLFDRLGADEQELFDDLDCLALCERTDKAPFKQPKARSLCYEYRFDPSQEFKGASNSFYLLGMENEEGKNIKVSYVKEESDLEHGVIVLKASNEPPTMVSLIPDEYVNANAIIKAIFNTVEEYEKGELTQKKSAIIDFLTRAKPRILTSSSSNNTENTINYHNGDIVTSSEPEIRLKQIITAVSNLDNSYLPIQGPPGAGKTFTGKKVIAHLLKSGAKIGISSNSHKAINNLLISTAEYCKEHNIEATFCCTKDTDKALTDLDVTITKNNKLADHIQSGCVIGTTAWGFAREELTDQFDYLFIDEAGQVATANLVAMSRSAKNLVLMGDQMQLGQPSQGSHPAESGLSVLDYLLHETPTISSDMGVFLDMTYRMHSKVNAFISQLVYDGKLQAYADNDKRVLEQSPLKLSLADLNNKQAGIVFVPVEHEGNSQASDEEVATIKALANSLLGRTFYTGEVDDDNNPITRKIDWQDMLFVAPYNHQVSKLKQALGEDLKIGSVDKFQGQEAPIVFLSMCASDANESPRGIDFLFDKNRLNVAISRAQTLAIVVGNPELGKTSVNSVEQMRKVNLFDGLVVREW